MSMNIQQRGCGAEVRVQHGRGRVRIREVRITTVEPAPAEPEKSTAGNGHHDVARRVVHAVLHHAWTDDGRCDER
jgi:hypothetical protein